MRDRRASEKKEQELLDFARVYLSEAFPNPDREGCPADSELRSLALNPRKSGPEVTEHLAACSPCFKRYGELLAELKSRREAEEGLSWRRISAWSEAHPILAGTALVCAVLLAIGAGLLFRRIRIPNVPPVETHRGPSPGEPVKPPVTYTPFSLDLSSLSPVRGAEPPTNGEVRPVAVPGSSLDLTLTLPLASAEGPYDLKLTAGGHTIWSRTAQAHLSNGKTLIQLQADFSQIPTGLYNLEVQSSSGIHLIQAVAIQCSPPKSGEQRP